jgi:acylglycerol lipase
MNETIVVINHSEGLFESKDGLKLFEQSWYPADEPKGFVIIVHGYAEHCARYKFVAKHLTDNGYAVFSFDLRGHGRSEGAKTFINSYDEYLSDLDLFLSRVKAQAKEKPIFLLGHSMGGAISTLFTITRKPEIRGLILSAAALKISASISPLLVRLSGVIGQILPTVKTIKLNSRYISRDPEVVSVYDSDPFIYRGGIPARTGAELTSAINQIQKSMSTLELPLLIMHGTDDRLTDMEGSKQLFAKASSNDKTLKLYDGLYHEILNEPEKERVLGDIVEWMDKRL